MCEINARESKGTQFLHGIWVLKTKRNSVIKTDTYLMFPTPYVLITYVRVSLMVRRVRAASLEVALTANITSTSGAERTEMFGFSLETEYVD